MIVYGILFALVGSIAGTVFGVLVIITLIIPGSFLIELINTGHISADHLTKWYLPDSGISIPIIFGCASTGNLYGLVAGLIKAWE